MMLVLGAALAMGLAGSVHCLGMCGPLHMAMGMPVAQASWGAVGRRVVFHLGRAVAYGSLGVAAGLLGQAGALVLGQQWLGVLAGVALVAMALLPGLLALVERRLQFLAGLGHSFRQVFGQHITLRTYPGAVLAGYLNGLLPCGLVYMALVAALGTGSMAGGVAFMVAFGLGNTPALLGLALAAGRLPWLQPRRWARWQPALLLLVGLLFALRGSNLGIPMLSPRAATQQPAQPQPALHCCTQPAR